MKQRKNCLVLYPGIILLLFFNSCRYDEIAIRQAVQSQLELYPQSTLQDIYKSFFQDEFGPGHLLENQAGAREYYEYELSGMISAGNHLAEPCGTGKNFYRVPMDLVKDGIISDSSYFDAFLESASSFTMPDVKRWKEKWAEIVSVIEKMNREIQNFQRDKDALTDMLDHGEAAVHHSQAFVDHYDPHYRIMSKKQWEKLIHNQPELKP